MTMPITFTELRSMSNSYALSHSPSNSVLKAVDPKDPAYPEYLKALKDNKKRIRAAVKNKIFGPGPGPQNANGEVGIVILDKGGAQAASGMTKASLVSALEADLQLSYGSKLATKFMRK